MSDLIADFLTPSSEIEYEGERKSRPSSSSFMFIQPGYSEVPYFSQQDDITQINQLKPQGKRQFELHEKPIKQSHAEKFLSNIPMGGEGQLLMLKSSIESNSHNSEMETTPSGVVSSYGNQNYVYKLIKSMENDNNLKSGVYIFAPKKYYPMVITSFMGDDGIDEDMSVFDHDSDSDEELLCEKMKKIRKNKDPDTILNVSYREYIKPFTKVNTENIYLDNAFIQQSLQTTVFVFSGWNSSIIPYTKETQLKEELNSIFQQKYPDIPPSFTLSKLRKLKHLALMLCQPSIQFLTIHISLVNQETVNFDIGTLALAFCYFERLVLYGHVNKENRKIVIADCLLIAYKFNQLCEVPSSQKASDLRIFLEELNVLFGKSANEIIDNEIAVLVALEFSLLIPYDQYIEHIFWILRKLDTNLQTYLGEEMYNSYYQSIHYEDMNDDEVKEGEEDEEGVDENLSSA